MVSADETVHLKNQSDRFYISHYAHLASSATANAPCTVEVSCPFTLRARLISIQGGDRHIFHDLRQVLGHEDLSNQYLSLAIQPRHITSRQARTRAKLAEAEVVIRWIEHHVPQSIRPVVAAQVEAIRKVLPLESRLKFPE